VIGLPILLFSAAPHPLLACATRERGRVRLRRSEDRQSGIGHPQTSSTTKRGLMPVPETHERDQTEPSKGNYLLNADGSGTGTIDNPAQGAIGVVLRDRNGHLIAETSKQIGPAINTVAEYRALIEGLKIARSRGIQRIRVFLDSELVVDQVNGRAKVRKEHIRLLHAEAWSLLEEFPNIRTSWVPRRWNAEADALATKALLDR
jgi:ribonuclease HI